MIRKLLEKLKLLKPQPKLDHKYLLWLKNGLDQANVDQSWYLKGGDVK